MITVKFNGTNHEVRTDGTFFGILEAIVDEWNREDWKEVVLACKDVASGKEAPEFEAKWGVTFERA